jgi:hypothetical protein
MECTRELRAEAKTSEMAAFKRSGGRNGSARVLLLSTVFIFTSEIAN